MESPLQRFREPIASSALTIDFPPENDIAGYVASLPSSSPAAVEEALDRLIELTAWQEENQRAVAELGGPSLVVDLAKVRAKYLAAQTQPPAAGPDGADLRTVMKSLQLLLNLTGNEYLALKTGEVSVDLAFTVDGGSLAFPVCITHMLAHLECACQHAVFVAVCRCLGP
jgi:hypothetical protein